MIAVVFDTETTGLIQNHSIKIDQQPEVIEFYGAEVDLADDGKILNEIDLLIKPKRPLSDTPDFGSKKTITQITGITNEMLADCKPFGKVANEIEFLLTTAKYVIAHNVSFDQEMIDMEFERLHRMMIWPRTICTVESTIHLKGGRLSLTKLHEHLFGMAFTDAHRAKHDVQALIRCCVELYKRGLL
jgi:DNA polymerase-3 subunit alpha